MNTVQIQRPNLPTYGYQYGRGLFNQNMAQAQAAGDQRFNLKQYDRAGMSRGGAQQYQAGVMGANAMANGIAQAYGQLTQDDANIANMAQGSEVEQEKMATALASLNAQRRADRQGLGISILQGLI